jgi:pimeloyl-ACP methyl ester carboxylesterase
VTNTGYEDGPMRDARTLIAAVTGGLQPRHVRLPAGALVLHCLLWGNDDAPPVLLVHGNGGHAHWWDALVPYFIPGYRLIAPDLRGHGESDWPAAPAYAIGDTCADLLAIVDHLGLPPTAVIAHSMGARAAAWFAAQHPGRVRRLAMLDTSLAGVDEETARRYRGRMVGQREGRGHGSYAAACTAFRFVPPEPGVDASIVADLAHHAVVERAAGVWTFRFDRAVLSLEGDGAGDLSALVASLPGPLWVGRGIGSMLHARPDFDLLAQRRPDVPVHDFPGAHHFFLSHPREAGTALRAFLDCQ